MAKAIGVGVIGCGNISTTYLGLAPLFRGIEMRACADLNADLAKARAAEYGVRAERWTVCWPPTTSTSSSI
jgi:predicted dehydrogenase